MGTGWSSLASPGWFNGCVSCGPSSSCSLGQTRFHIDVGVQESEQKHYFLQLSLRPGTPSLLPCSTGQNKSQVSPDSERKNKIHSLMEGAVKSLCKDHTQGKGNNWDHLYNQLITISNFQVRKLQEG